MFLIYLDIIYLKSIKIVRGSCEFDRYNPDTSRKCSFVLWDPFQQKFKTCWYTFYASLKLINCCFVCNFHAYPPDHDGAAPDLTEPTLQGSTVIHTTIDFE